MQKNLKKGDQSCYEIELIVTEEDREKSKQKILKEFQKDLVLPGFRKGHVPIDKVEENVKPEFLTLGIYENLISTGLQEIVKENPTIKFIGEPYQIHQKKENEHTIITLKLDIFPEVEVLNDDWKKYSLKKIDTTVKQEEIDEALLRIKKNYADYKDAESIALDTISKIALTYLDKDGKEIDKGYTYVGEQEFAEHEFFKKEFLGKKKGEEFKIVYDVKTIPEVLLSKKAQNVAELKCTIQDVKQIILPEINDQILEKLFGKDSHIKNEKDLLTFIQTSIADHKYETELIKQIEEFLVTVKNQNFKVVVPHTLIEEESKSRLANLEKRFGSKEKVDEYFKKIGEEQTKIFMDDIKRVSQESLEKFFVLQKIVQLLNLQINREHPEHLEIEKKLYEKLVKND